MATIETIKVQGLREFQSALREMDGESQKKLRVVLNRAADLVVQEAVPRIPSKSGGARKSVKAQSSQREVRVKGGGAKIPYYPWLDFGGNAGPDKRISRPFKTKGRYIYPAWDQVRPKALEALQEGLIELAQEAGLEVS